MYRVTIDHTTQIRVKSAIMVPVDHWNGTKETLDYKKATGALYTKITELRREIEKEGQHIMDLVQMFPGNANKDWLERALRLLCQEGTEVVTREEVLRLMNEEEHQEEEQKEPERPTITSLMDRFLDEPRHNGHEISEGRKRSYRVVFRMMLRYELFSNQVLKNEFAWDIDNVSRNDLEDLFCYIQKESELAQSHKRAFARILEQCPVEVTPKHTAAKIQERGGNYMLDVKKKVKTFWGWLLESELTRNNPFIGIKKMGKYDYGTPFYLTKEERNKVADLEIADEGLAVQRDIFVFQCMVGCRVGDLYKLTPSNVVGTMLEYTPNKTKDETGVTVRVPLLFQAQELIKKYQDLDHNGRLFPFISTDKYNDAIKEVLTMCEITRMVSWRNPLTGKDERRPINELASSHMARRTFVGNVYKVVQDPNIIGKMSGHVEGSQAFARYRDIDNEILADTINKIQ